VRFRPLLLRVGVVGALDLNVGRKPYIAESKSRKTRQEIIVAKITEFYIPNSFRKKVTWVSLAQRGKVIEFSLRIKKSA
jgi:hypothetical protein